MSDNNKVSIDVEISINGNDQLNGISTAFDKLRTSVNGLSNPLNGISNSINSLNNNLLKYNDTLAKVNDQNKQLAKSSGETSNKTSDLISSFATWRGIIELVEAGLTGMEAALTGGLAIITTFAPEIIKFVSALFKGKDAIDQAKMSLNNLNNAFSSTDYSNAVQQISNLKINLGLAKKGLLEKNDVLKQYNDSVGKTMGAVSSLNQLEDKLTKNGNNYIQMTLLKAAAQLALQDAAKKAYEAEQDKLKSDDDSLTFWDKTVDFVKRIPGYANNPDIISLSDQADKEKKDKADERRKEMVGDATKQKDALLAIAKKFQTDAANIAKNSRFDFFSGQTVDTSVSNKPKKPKSNQVHPAAEALQVKADGFAKIIELDKLHYDAEQALLDERLDKKLISQQEYQEQSHQLEEKYHVGIGEKIKRFNKEELAATQKQQQDLVAAQQHQEVMAADEHAVKKAVLPAHKLAAEKQLIMDKYDFEVQQAAAAGKDTTEIRKQYEEETTALTKRYEEERKAFALQTAQKVSDTAFNILKGSIQSQADAKIKGLETQKQAELSNSNLTADQKRAIEDKYKKKEAEEKVKAFKAEQKASILQAVINGALAITKATSQTGVLAPFVIPGIIVETAIQVATIAKQKAPQYAKGGLHYHSDGRGALLSGYSRTDDTNAYLRSGEAVVVSEAMRNPWARNLVSAINVAHGGRDFSVTNPGRGYAIDGVFTDGGNANRYYSQPANDAKDLANTLAYQMINNFPPKCISNDFYTAYIIT